MIKSTRMRSRGFTAIELIVILVIVGILSVFVFITLDPYKGIKLNAAAHKVAADVRYARDLAMSTTDWHGVKFQVDPVNQYNVYTTTGTVDANVEDPAKFGSDLVVDLNSNYGIIISSVNLAGGSQVEFDPYGAPHDDKNGSAFTSSGNIVLGIDSQTKTITITATAGVVSIQ